MGDAAPALKMSPEGETLLCILPFPEPKALLDRLRKKHPHVKILYREMLFSGPKGEMWKPTSKIPDGGDSSSFSIVSCHEFSGLGPVASEDNSASIVEASASDADPASLLLNQMTQLQSRSLYYLKSHISNNSPVTHCLTTF
jgi:hypothetical protein